MRLIAAISRLSKYYSRLSQLNRMEGWGFIKSISTYFDYLGAFVIHGCLIIKEFAKRNSQFIS